MYRFLNRYLLLTLALLLVNQSAQANQSTEPLNKYFSPVKKVGETRFKYLWLQVYDIALLTQDGKYHPDYSFALEINYLMDFDSQTIAKRSIKEMNDQGFKDAEKLKHWEKRLSGIFPDVKKGDSILGVKDEMGNAHFYYNGQALGSINDEEFSKRFFDIWLGTNSNFAKYTQKLLNQ